MTYEEANEFHRSQCEGLAEKETILIKCTVSKEFASKLLTQMYSKEKPFDGFNLHTISWDESTISKQTVDQIIELLGRKP